MITEDFNSTNKKNLNRYTYLHLYKYKNFAYTFMKNQYECVHEEKFNTFKSLMRYQLSQLGKFNTFKKAEIFSDNPMNMKINTKNMARKLLGN